MNEIRIFDANLEFVSLVKEEVDKIFENYDGKAKIIQKPDNTPVTEIDLTVSRTIKNILTKNHNFKNFNFYCEEEVGEFKTPMIAVDPIDGTRELIENVPECTVSIAFLTIDQKNDFGWIYNPFTKFEVSTVSDLLNNRKVAGHGHMGLISRTEWKRKDVTPLLGKVHLMPVGSIAYKLALLASGIGTYTISFRYKNIWDIAAGTLLCEKAGILLYSSQGLIANWKKFPELQGPLLWCRPEDFKFLKGQLQI